MSSSTDESPITQFAPNFKLSHNELEIIRFWKEHEIYKILTEKLKDAPPFIFMDGPPFVSSDCLHNGHILISMIKSTILNFMQMHGYNVSNKNGKDCHGLPIEMLVNKLLDVHTKEQVEGLGIHTYNAKCKEIIHSYSGSWNGFFERVGRFMDFNNEYKTMDVSFMLRVWEVFGELWKKALIYRGYQIMPFSTHCCTPLSNFEAGQNYKIVKDTSVYVKLPLVDEPNVSLIAWTTTPWTLPSNVALCVNPNLNYVRVMDNKTHNVYIVEETKINSIFDTPKKKTTGSSSSASSSSSSSPEIPYVIQSNFKGDTLYGLSYIPPFDYFKEMSTYNPKFFTVITDDFVTADSGTGVVHIAPAFGEDDFNVSLKHNIIALKDVGSVCPVDDNGRYTEQIYDREGVYVIDANKDIIKSLKEKGLLIKTLLYEHSYPFCWRTETPLIYKAVSSFFVAVTKIKDRMVELNREIHWVPSHTGSGRFHNWLSTTKDWGISRYRYFGTPIPVWVSDDGEEMVCVTSLEQLADLANLSPEEIPTDIHPEFINHITIPSQQGKGVLRRVQDLCDCWFESGSVPYAQNTDVEAEYTPPSSCSALSDFVCEGLDQTRGWFYTLLVLSTALFDKPPFKNVICAGLVLDENGNKISKKLGNFVDPRVLLERYGADALRLYLISSPASHGEPFKFKDSEISMIEGKLFQLFNGVKFFLEHYIKFTKDNNLSLDTNIYKHSSNVMDRWILSRTTNVITNIENMMSNYNLHKVTLEIFNFVEDLINWYIKFNRNRIKGKKCSLEDQMCALSTLYTTFMITSQMLAPFIPFLSETIFQKLKVLSHDLLERDALSVHHMRYPKRVEEFVDDVVERRMLRLQMISTMVRNMRANTSIKIPIKSVTIHCSDDPSFIDDIKQMERYLNEEINALEIIYSDAEFIVNYRIVPNYRVLGPKLKDRCKVITDEIMKIHNSVLATFANGEIGTLTVDYVHDGNLCSYSLLENEFSLSKTHSIELQEHEIMQAKDNIVVIINTVIDPKVRELHMKRLYVVAVQSMRKKTLLRPWNKIGIYYDVLDNPDTDPKMKSELVNMLTAYKDTLTEDLEYPSSPISECLEDDPLIITEMIHDIYGCKLLIRITDYDKCLNKNPQIF